MSFSVGEGSNLAHETDLAACHVTHKHAFSAFFPIRQLLLHTSHKLEITYLSPLQDLPKPVSQKPQAYVQDDFCALEHALKS